MLRSEDLAGDRFEDILKNAKAEIAKIYPAWSNHNTSDPGITVIELMAYLSEVQRYHLNFIQRGHYLRYLKLLGTAPRGVEPSKTYLKLRGSGDLPEKTLFYADKLPFEISCRCTPDDNEIIGLESGGEVLQNEGDILSERVGGFGKAAFYPFGHENGGDVPYPVFKIRTQKAVTAGSVLGIYFAVGQTERFTAIASTADMPVVIEANVGGDNAEILLDETMGFTKSGVLLLKVGGVSGDEIAFHVSEGEFPVVPVITSVIMNVIPAYQRETLAYTEIFENVHKEIAVTERPYMLMSANGSRRSEITDYQYDNGRIVLPEDEYQRIEAVFVRPDFSDSAEIGTANGLCDLRLKLDIPNILQEGLAVYINEDDGFYKWDVTSDFACADKFTRCCVYDVETSELVFGNGRKGRPPCGKIFIFGCAVSMGEDGNIKEGMVSSTDTVTGISAENILPSVGGSAPQSIDDCFTELRRRVSEPECCITLGDFEKAVRGAAGVPDKRVKAFLSERKENCVCIAAECLIGAKGDTPLMRNIKRNILPRVLVGTKIEFPSVRYSGVNIFISVSASLYYSDCKMRTEKALRDYFNSSRVNFGDTISVNDISRYVCDLAWVNTVRSVDLSVSASDGERLIGGDIRLKNICLPIADKVTVTIYN